MGVYNTAPRKGSRTITAENFGARLSLAKRNRWTGHKGGDSKWIECNFYMTDFRLPWPVKFGGCHLGGYTKNKISFHNVALTKNPDLRPNRSFTGGSLMGGRWYSYIRKRFLSPGEPFLPPTFPPSFFNRFAIDFSRSSYQSSDSSRDMGFCVCCTSRAEPRFLRVTVAFFIIVIYWHASTDVLRMGKFVCMGSMYVCQGQLTFRNQK